MNVETQKSRETITELSNEQTKLMETQIEEMLSKLGEDTDLEKCYLKNYGEEYTGDIDQVKQLFSLAFIRLRDSKEIKSENLLEIKVRNGGNLSVRDENGTRFTIVSDGKIVKSLGEEKQMRGLIYTKIEYKDPSGETVIGYVSKSYTKEISENLNQLNGYLINLGVQPSKHVKRNIYKSIDSIGTYRGTRNQNEAIYHYLVQNNEFDKSLAQLVSKEERGKVKEEAAAKAPKAASSEGPKLRTKASTQTLDTNDMLEGETRRVYEKIFADTTIVEYLNTNFKGDFDRFIKRTFGIRGGLNNIDVTGMARAYAYLFINAHKIDLYSYMKKHGYEIKQKNELYERYSKSLSFSTDFKNLKTLYGLVIDKELGEETLAIMKKTNTVELQYAHGLDPNSVISYGIEKGRDGGPMCSLTAKKNLKRLNVPNPAENHSRTLIRQLRKNGGIETSITSLETRLKEKARQSNVFDVYPETKNGHRAAVFLGKDGQLYVLDPYYYNSGEKEKKQENPTKPQLLKNRVTSMEKVCSQVMIGKGYRV